MEERIKDVIRLKIGRDWIKFADKNFGGFMEALVKGINIAENRVTMVLCNGKLKRVDIGPSQFSVISRPPEKP